MLVTLLSMIDNAPLSGMDVGIVSDSNGQVDLTAMNPTSLIVNGMLYTWQNMAPTDLTIWVDPSLVNTGYGMLCYYNETMTPEPYLPIPRPQPSQNPAPPGMYANWGLTAIVKASWWNLQQRQELQQKHGEALRRLGRRAGRPELLGD